MSLSGFPLRSHLIREFLSCLRTAAALARGVGDKVVDLAVGVSGGFVLSTEVVGLLLLVGFDELVLLVRELADVLGLSPGSTKLR